MTLVNNRFRLYLSIAFFFIGSISPILGIPTSVFKEDVSTVLIQHLKTQKSYISTSDVAISILNLSDLSQHLSQATSFNIRLAPGAIIVGKTVISIQFLNELNQIITKTNLITHVTVQARFLKTTRTIPADQMILPEDVEVIYTDEYAKPVNAIRSIDALVGKKTIVQLNKDVYLAEFMLKKIPLVRRGDQIKLEVIRDGLTVTIPVEALEDGVLSQSIRVKTLLNDPKVMEGVVLDSKTVRIHPLR